MSIKSFSVYTTIPLLLLIIYATVVIANMSIIPEKKAMAQVVGTATNSTTNATSANPLLLTYTNSTAGIKIQYPFNWQQARSDNPSVTGRFYSPTAGVLGIYQEHKSNVFKPGEDIILYAEPVGFTHVPVTVNNTKLYLINLTASIILSDKQGNILFGKENIPILNIISHNQNTELYARLRVGQSSPFPAGGYVITYILNDVPSGKSFKIVKDITVAG